MTDEEPIVDIEQELNDLLTKVQPNLQDVIKRVNRISNYCWIVNYYHRRLTINFWL